MMTTNSAQTVTGTKTWQSDQAHFAIYDDPTHGRSAGDTYYIPGTGSGLTATTGADNRDNSYAKGFFITYGGVGGKCVYFDSDGIIPTQYSTLFGNIDYNLGKATKPFNNLYLKGSLSDGTNSIAIANIADVNDIPTNYVTTDTAQTITGIKTLPTQTVFEQPQNTSGHLNFSINNTISKKIVWENGALSFRTNDADLSGAELYFDNSVGYFGPTTDASNASQTIKDLGYYNNHQASKRWRNLYLSGNISDGTNTVAVANIADKSNSETWTFTLADGTTVTKTIVLG